MAIPMCASQACSSIFHNLRPHIPRKWWNWPLFKHGNKEESGDLTAEKTKWEEEKLCRDTRVPAYLFGAPRKQLALPIMHKQASNNYRFFDKILKSIQVKQCNNRNDYHIAKELNYCLNTTNDQLTW